jgi:hypothetical protein
MRLATAAVRYFAVVFVAGFLLGSIRMFWLDPRMEKALAVLCETPFLLLAMVLAARWVTERFRLTADRTSLVAVGRRCPCSSADCRSYRRICATRANAVSATTELRDTGRHHLRGLAPDVCGDAVVAKLQRKPANIVWIGTANYHRNDLIRAGHTNQSAQRVIILLLRQGE